MAGHLHLCVTKGSASVFSPSSSDISNNDRLVRLREASCTLPFIIYGDFFHFVIPPLASDRESRKLAF